MPFPTTAVLDTFDRANSTTTIGSSWTPLESGATKDRGISSNQAYDPDGVYSWIYWNAAQYGPDCEAYVTIVIWSTQDDTHTVMLRLKDMTQDAYTFDGYQLKAYIFGADTLALVRIDNSVSTQLGATISTTLAAGHKVGLSAVGATLTAYQDSGSGFVSMGTRTDATYANAGYLGFYTPGDTAWRQDDFGGGTLVSPPPPLFAPRMPPALLAR